MKKLGKNWSCVLFFFISIFLGGAAAFATEEADIAEGCKLAYDYYSSLPALLHEKEMMDIIKEVSKKDEKFIRLCKDIATATYTYTRNADYAQVLLTLGKGKALPELFDPPEKKCFVRISDELYKDSPDTCKAGCQGYVMSQTDRLKRFGYHAGYQIVYQTSRYTVRREPIYIQDLMNCLEGTSVDRFSCMVDHCIEAEKGYRLSKQSPSP